MLAVLDDVTTRPAPGPTIPPPGAVRGPHHRDPLDAARCVCGEPWVQAMTCHPCRYPHLAEWCVDGPGERLAVAGGGRLVYTYPARAAGRWCNCQHSPIVRQADDEAPAPRVVTAGEGIQVSGSAWLEREGLRLAYGAGPLLVTRVGVDPAPDTDPMATAVYSLTGPGELRSDPDAITTRREPGRPAPFLAPALEAAAAEWGEFGPGLVEFLTTRGDVSSRAYASSIKIGPVGTTPPADTEAERTASQIARGMLISERVKHIIAAGRTSRAEEIRKGMREATRTAEWAASVMATAERNRARRLLGMAPLERLDERNRQATQAFIRGLTAVRPLTASARIEGLYSLEPPADPEPGGAYCGDVPARPPLET